MKTKTLFTILLFTMVTLVQAQEITEENYLKIDKEIWDTYYTKTDSISAQFKLHPEKKDSLIKESEIIYNIASLKNIEAAIKYAAVPSGLQRLFMVRLDIPKDTIKAVWNRLPKKMQLSPYGKSILMHIENKQLEEGDLYKDFEATDANGQPFKLSSLSGKNILLFYGGLDCMGKDNRNELVRLYDNTSRDSLEIVVYNKVSSLENLKKAKDEYHVKFIMVSDFLGDHTPFKIIYGAQVTPTVFLISKEGKIVLKTTGRNLKKELDRFKDKPLKFRK